MKRYKFLESLSAQAVLREEVGGVLLTEHFAEIDSAGAHGLLGPQRVGVEVPQLAQALPGANADGSARVGPYSKVRLYSQVFE